MLLTGCISTQWHAKEVYGQVIDEQSGNPVEGVTVFRSLDGKYKQVGITDENGKFYVSGVRKIHIVIPFPGDYIYPSQLLFKKEGFINAIEGCETITGAVVSRETPVKGDVLIKLKKNPANN